MGKLKAVELLWFLAIIPVFYFTIRFEVVWFILMWIFFPFVYTELEYRLDKK